MHVQMCAVELYMTIVYTVVYMMLLVRWLNIANRFILP